MFQTVPLSKSHPKSEFRCENDVLTNYIHKQANQDIRRNLSVCFVYLNAEDNQIKGYYTLSNASILVDQLPESFRKRFPSAYDSIPATLLGRLARDNRYAGKGIGEILLVDSLKRALLASQSAASFAVIVDPIDDKAEHFYQKYGFIKLPECRRMFIPMETIGKLF